MRPLTSFIRRKYYLNRKVKAFCTIKARSKVLFMTADEHINLAGKYLKWVNELTGTYSYQIQYKMDLPL